MSKADRDLNKLFPPFRAAVKLVLDAANAWCKVHRPGYKAIITEGYRTVARQQALYAQGRTKPGPIVTQRNGTTNPSEHQSACAVDFALVSPDGKMVWNDGEFWKYLGHLARLNGLRWGGDWKTFKDLPHVEAPKSNKQFYADARAWKKSQGLS